MTTSNDPDDLEHPHDAAHWFARMHSGEATEAERRSFEAWRGADPEHERQYRNLGFLWDATARIPDWRLRGMLAEPARAPSLPARRRFGLGLAAACSLAIAAGVVGGFGWLEPRHGALVLTTRKGERRRVTLPDGSVLDLNTDTLAVAGFYDDSRRVELQRGEVFFDVRPDAGRPFLVDAGMGRITVTGTRFNVRRDEDALRVSVQSGSVRLQSGHWWNRSERQLTADQQAVARKDTGLSDVQAANVANIAAWQRGKIIFNNAPLAQVVQEMNRYLDQPARLDAPDLRDHRLSGIFSVDQPESIMDALPVIAPVRVHRLADGRTRIVAR